MPPRLDDNLEVRTDLALALVSREGLESQTLLDLYAKINEAGTPASLLECVVALTEKAVDLSTILQQCEGNFTADYRSKLLTEILFALLDKLSPEILTQLFKEAAQVNDIRALVKFLALLRQNGIELGVLGIDFSPLLALNDAQVNPQPEPAANDLETFPEIAVDEDGEPIFDGDISSANIAGFVDYFAKPGPLSGMNPPKSNGEFKNSPQKDIVRALWGARLKAKFGRMDPRRKKSWPVFSLLGKGAADLPIYERDLEIPRGSIYAAEYNPAAAAEMRENLPGLNVFSGNCCQFARTVLADDKVHNTRFGIMNLDICGTPGEFFASGDAEILGLAGRGCELNLNARIRQDAVDLVDAKRLLLVLSVEFPEITAYFEKLKESKMRLHSSERVAENMALRDFYMVFKLLTSLPSQTLDCCRDVVADLERKIKAMALLGVMDETVHKDRYEKMHPVDQLANLYMSIRDEAVATAVDNMPDWTVGVALKKMRRELKDMTAGQPKVSGHDNAAATGDIIAGLVEFMEQEYLARGLTDAKPFTDKDKKDAEAFMRYFVILGWAQLTRRYPTLVPTDIRRVTYMHDGNHTFETWMMTLEKPQQHCSIAEAMKLTLDKLLNGEDQFIDNSGAVTKYKPETRIRIPIDKNRILDAHGPLWNYHHPRRNVSTKELNRRRRQREIASDSRRTNRQRQ